MTPPEDTTTDTPAAENSTADAALNSTETTFDVIVIGAGAIGENVADRAVQGGLTTAQIGRAHV